jgi:hypothetical protein
MMTKLFPFLLSAFLATLGHAQAQTQNQTQGENQEREPLKMVFNPSDRDMPAEKIATNCPVSLAPVQDIRMNKETAGVGIRGSLLTGSLESWGNEGLAELKSFGIQLLTVPVLAEPSGTQINLEARLDRAYTWQVGLKIFSMLTMKMKYTSANGGVQEKTYRAYGDKTNMWGAETEYVTTLNYGMSNLLPALARDLKVLCDAGKLSVYEFVQRAPTPVKK